MRGQGQALLGREHSIPAPLPLEVEIQHFQHLSRMLLDLSRIEGTDLELVF
jgi:hypothetical protein